MNYYLLVYDRKRAEILQREEFGPRDRRRASAERLKRMIEFRDRSDIEVVLFGADSYDDLVKTHSRYFKTPNEILAGIDTVKR
jgi:hypothetical protein